MARRISLIIALLLVATACDFGTESTTTTSAVTTTPAPVETTTTSSSPTNTTLPSPTTTAVDLSGVQGIPDTMRSQLEDLIRDAQEARGLPFLSPPEITVVGDDELEARVRADIEEEAEDFPADEALYKMLGLLAEDADFEELLLDLYGEQVAGFYDGETGEIVVPAREDGFSIIQEATMVHELVHAITDQHFSFNPIFEQMLDEDRLDEATAYQALIEGDATMAEVQWLQTLTQREMGEFIAESLDIDSTSLNSTPRFLRESLLFPYDTGLAFVQELFVGGGWAAVNDAYTTLAELPGSSEQVITPIDYGVDLPVAVTIPDVSVPGYELERTSVWGEEGFRIMLNQGSGIAGLAEAVDGWGGDSYHQWFDGQNAALLIVFDGDTASDERELEEALLGFAMEDFPEDRFVWVEQLDGLVYFIAADVPEVGENIRMAVGLG
ncbi:MAG: hypothetical protein PVG83_06715 [Acidimicrobiia bacterium]|jgi:hypothetical protein